METRLSLAPGQNGTKRLLSKVLRSFVPVSNGLSTC